MRRETSSSTAYVSQRLSHAGDGQVEAPLTSRSVYRIASAEPIPRVQDERGIPILDSAGSQGKRLLQDETHNARDSSDNAYHRVTEESAKPRVLPDAHETHHSAFHSRRLRRLASEAKRPDRRWPGLVHQYAP